MSSSSGVSRLADLGVRATDLDLAPSPTPLCSVDRRESLVPGLLAPAFAGFPFFATAFLRLAAG